MEDPPKLFSVAHFLNRDEVEAVPSIWFTKDKSFCWWPSRKDVTKYVKNYQAPDADTWSKYKAKEMGVYGKFDLLYILLSSF